MDEDHGLAAQIGDFEPPSVILDPAVTRLLGMVACDSEGEGCVDDMRAVPAWTTKSLVPSLRVEAWSPMRARRSGSRSGLSSALVAEARSVRASIGKFLSGMKKALAAGPGELGSDEA